MKKRHVFLGALALLVGGLGVGAYVVSPSVLSGNPGEAPELGRTGDGGVGTYQTNFSLANQPMISTSSLVTGKIDRAERKLPVRIWYPASTISDAQNTQFKHRLAMFDFDPVELVIESSAVADAEPIAGEKYPLVLMSHGFRGWNTQFSHLAEHIASRGYVVASIDHQDQSASGLPSFVTSFANVLATRVSDQKQILSQILERAQSGTDPRLGLVDPANIGLIGYSMGGYGALASAGAAYDFSGAPFARIPSEAQDDLRLATQDPAPIKALITFAPWGSQPDNRVWTAESLARVRTPTLVVAGAEDDVVNYHEGIRWLFDNLTGADRHMLVYREARHNIVGNAFKLDGDEPFIAAEFLNEPVWRNERLNAINQHFVAAFLDLHLKGDETMRKFLTLPTVNSNSGEWPIGFGDQLNGSFAGKGEESHWPGFQRRWALGMEFYSAKSGQHAQYANR